MDKRLQIPEAIFGCVLRDFVASYRYTLEAFLAFCSIGDGRVGKALENAVAWLVEGVPSGFRDGINEVMQGKAAD